MPTEGRETRFVIQLETLVSSPGGGEVTYVSDDGRQLVMRIVRDPLTGRILGSDAILYERGKNDGEPT